LPADIRDRRVDIVVVYKVDRLTRSLADFAKLVEQFDAHGVSFVSVTQQFNTTTSMGRLTLNVLLSFAQFEREVTSERIRDKIGASKRRGLWVGGMVPLGYVSRDKKLFIQDEEAERVRTIFRRYLDLGSIGLLLADLRVDGVVYDFLAYEVLPPGRFRPTGFGIAAELPLKLLHDLGQRERLSLWPALRIGVVTRFEARVLGGVAIADFVITHCRSPFFGARVDSAWV
jgi:Resolvase, N terminal domain